MTDRELLEMAARAAGVDATWSEWTTGRVAEFGCIKYQKHEALRVNGKVWNPLTDDGDAHRLESYLRLDVTWGNGSVTVGGVTERYSHGDDPAAVKRRAIVRAAAAIGSKQ